MDLYPIKFNVDVTNNAPILAKIVIFTTVALAGLLANLALLAATAYAIGVGLRHGLGL